MSRVLGFARQLRSGLVVLDRRRQFFSFNDTVVIEVSFGNPSVFAVLSRHLCYFFFVEHAVLVLVMGVENVTDDESCPPYLRPAVLIVLY